MVGELTVIDNAAATVTVATAVFEQVPSLPVTVYEEVTVGLASAVFVPVGNAPALHE